MVNYFLLLKLVKESQENNEYFHFLKPYPNFTASLVYINYNLFLNICICMLIYLNILYNVYYKNNVLYKIEDSSVLDVCFKKISQICHIHIYYLFYYKYFQFLKVFVFYGVLEIICKVIAKAYLCLCDIISA